MSWETPLHRDGRRQFCQHIVEASNTTLNHDIPSLPHIERLTAPLGIGLMEAELGVAMEFYRNRLFQFLLKIDVCPKLATTERRVNVCPWKFALWIGITY